MYNWKTITTWVAYIVATIAPLLLSLFTRLGGRELIIIFFFLTLIRDVSRNVRYKGEFVISFWKSR